jgi:hypothetical protein
MRRARGPNAGRQPPAGVLPATERQSSWARRCLIGPSPAQTAYPSVATLQANVVSLIRGDAGDLRTTTITPLAGRSPGSNTSSSSRQPPVLLSTHSRTTVDDANAASSVSPARTAKACTLKCGFRVSVVFGETGSRGKSGLDGPDDLSMSKPETSTGPVGDVAMNSGGRGLLPGSGRFRQGLSLPKQSAIGVALAVGLGL